MKTMDLDTKGLIICVFILTHLSRAATELYHREEQLGNNTLVSLNELGENATESLHCTTQNPDCCSEDMPTFGWFYPNGSKIANTDHSLYSTADVGVFMLSYNKATILPAGIYKCVLPAENGAALSYYAGIYPDGNGFLVGQRVEFELLTEHPTSFKLLYTTYGGPASTVSWRKEDAPLNHDKLKHAVYKHISNQVTATYRNELVINAYAPGSYTVLAYNKNIDCSHVSNPETLLLSTLEVKGIHIPQSVAVNELDPGIMTVTWNADHLANESYTGFKIFLTDLNCTQSPPTHDGCREENYMPKESREFQTHNVKRGRTYQIEIIALSHQLPSKMTEPVYLDVSNAGNKFTRLEVSLIATITIVVVATLLIISIVILVIFLKKRYVKKT